MQIVCLLVVVMKCTYITPNARAPNKRHLVSVVESIHWSLRRVLLYPLVK